MKTRKEVLDIVGDYLLQQSLNQKQEKKEFSHDDLLMKELLNEIRQLGYYVDDFWLQVQNIIDVRLIDVYKKYIHKFDKKSITDRIIAYLGCKEYKEATEYCIEMYRKEILQEEYDGVGGLKWRWGRTIYEICDGRYVDTYLELIQEKSEIEKQCRNFSEIILLLSKLKERRAIPIILSYLDIENNKYWLNGVVIEALGNYRDLEYVKYITPFLTDKDSYTRNKAKAAIKKIENANKGK
ncbi:MAG: hypothetical protein LBP62_06015 [Clostridiales bacterium]|jgi:HEAT repeat protein|nr:hypothetical protein [Clostridiales bacterium]